MKKLLVLLVMSLMGIGIVSSPDVRAGGGSYEAQLYAITEWTDTCSAGSRSLWDNMGDAWYDEITDSGFRLFGTWCLWGHCDDYFSRDRRWVNGAMSAAPFAEQTLFAWAQDQTYVDEGDAAMICTHGGDDGGFWRGKMRNKDGNDDCYINARNELRVGDYDLEFLHLSSCHSLDDNMISGAWQVFRRSGATAKLHQLDGFHGCMWIGDSFISDYEDFADDAFDMAIGYSWMINMYRTNVNGQYTQCPIAYAVGATANDCITRLTTERYNTVRSDPSEIAYYCYYYYPNCDPDCEDPFGQDVNN